MSVRTGQKAPTFTLPSKPGNPVDLSEHIGREKVVLLFFPFCFSPVCTDEMCTFRDDWSKWKSLDASVFGISIDSPFVTEKFRESENLPFPLLSDFNKEVATEWGVLHEELAGMRGVAKRAAFVIDSDGTVVYDSVNDNPKEQVDFNAIAAAVSGQPATT